MLGLGIGAVLGFVGGLLVGRKVWAGKLVGTIGDVITDDTAAIQAAINAAKAADGGRVVSSHGDVAQDATKHL